MLKIKDDVDLKELEKFGLKFDGWIYEYKQNNFTGLRVKSTDRRIGIYNSADIIVEKETLVKLYDLIESKLVEKVND